METADYFGKSAIVRSGSDKDGDLVLRIPLTLLPNPMAVNIWDWNGATSLEDFTNQIQQCLTDRIFVKVPFDTWMAKSNDPNLCQESFVQSYNHAARIAYLIENPTDDPIEIDVGLPQDHFEENRTVFNWMIEDGNHRLSASFYKQEPYIDAVVSGSVAEIEHNFNVSILEKEKECLKPS